MVRVPILGSCSIGRAPTSHVVLKDDKVSRRHAIIHVQDQHEFWLVDLGSSNGTYVNGRRVSQPVQLRDNSQIKIGPFLILFRQPPCGTGTASAPAGMDKTITDIRAADCWLLVADIESSTQLIQKLSADLLPIVTGNWFSACKQLVEENGGSINKFLGDGFLAYWLDGKDREREVAAALSALKTLQARSNPVFRFVVGHGSVLMGGVASLGEESLSGEAVNQVFRLEKLAAGLGLPRLANETAQQRLQPFLPTIAEGRHPLPGFKGEHQVFSF